MGKIDLSKCRSNKRNGNPPNTANGGHSCDDAVIRTSVNDDRCNSIRVLRLRSSVLISVSTISSLEYCSKRAAFLSFLSYVSVLDY